LGLSRSLFWSLSWSFLLWLSRLLLLPVRLVVLVLFLFPLVCRRLPFRVSPAALLFCPRPLLMLSPRLGLVSWVCSVSFAVFLFPMPLVVCCFLSLFLCLFLAVCCESRCRGFCRFALVSFCLRRCC